MIRTAMMALRDIGLLPSLLLVLAGTTSAAPASADEVAKSDSAPRTSVDSSSAKHNTSTSAVPTGLIEGADDAQIREYQSVGKAIASPDGRFFLYEWQKPYNWIRNTKGLPKAAVNRMQTLIYKVETDSDSPTSEYLFYPQSAASFWLGTLSPDGGKISFYELDNDTNKVKLGVYDVINGTIMEPKLTWFETGPPPDPARLDQPPVWVTNDQLIYPAAGKPTVNRPGTGSTKLVRAFVLKDTRSDEAGASPTGTIGTAVECFDCAAVYEQGRAAQRQSVVQTAAPESIGPDTKLLAQAPAAQLAIYTKQNHDLLSVLYKKSDSPQAQVIFENRRRGPYALEAKTDSDKRSQK